MHTAINHAKIFDGEKVLCQSGSILFDETGILAVGEGEQRGDVTIDGQGRTVLPSRWPPPLPPTLRKSCAMA